MVTWFRLDSTSYSTSGQKTRIILSEGNTWNGANGVHVWVDRSGTQYRLGVGRGNGITGATVNISTDTWYAVRFAVSINGGVSSDHTELYVNTTGAPWGTPVSSLSNLSLTSGFTNFRFDKQAYNSAGFIDNFDDTYSYFSDSTSPSSVWYSTVVTEPKIVLFNSSLGTKVANSTSVSNINDWFWDANVLYVKSTNSPDTDFTSPGVGAGKRNYTVDSNGKSYIKLQNMSFSCGNAGGTDGSILIDYGDGGPDGSGQSVGWTLDTIDSSFNSQSGAFFDSPYGTVLNSTFNYNGNIGIDFDSGHGMVGTNIVAHNNGLVGVYPGAIYGRLSLVLNNPTIYSNHNNGMTIDNADGVTVNGGSIYGNTYNGIWIDGAVRGANNITIRGVKIYDNLGDSGINVDSSNSTNININNNLLSNNFYGITLSSGSPSTSIYNNILKDNSTGIFAETNLTNASIKNNIFYNNTKEIKIASSINQNLAIDYNDWYHSAGGNFMEWKGVLKNFSDWKTASGTDSHSISSDPLFISSSDFRLQATSPAINSGVDVGLTKDYLNNPIFGLPDIGAYEYIGSLLVTDATVLNLVMDGYKTRYQKKSWSESYTAGINELNHTIYNLTPFAYYNFRINNLYPSKLKGASGTYCNMNWCKSDANGKITTTFAADYTGNVTVNMQRSYSHDR
jgi:hypothetical protein